MNTIDLHMHSIFSIDGTYQPEELYAMCKKQGIRYMAIADHNSVRGSRKLLDVKKKMILLWCRPLSWTALVKERIFICWAMVLM